MIDNQAKLLNVITGPGNDRVAFTTNPGFVDLHGGFISMGDGTDQIDFDRIQGGAVLAHWRYFDAQFGPLGSPISPALGYAGIRFDPQDMRTFDLDILLTDLIGGQITSSSMNSGDPLLPGPITYNLGSVGWLPASGAHRALSLVNRVDPDTDPALATSISALSNPPGRHFRINTAAYPNAETGGKS